MKRTEVWRLQLRRAEDRLEAPSPHFGLRPDEKKAAPNFDAAFLISTYSAAAGLASFESAIALPLTSTAYNRVRSDKYMRPLVKVGVL